MLVEINDNSNSKITYASISNGMIVVKSESTDLKAVKRINKIGNETYERFYKSIFGKITSIQIEENKFGEQQIKVGIQHKEMNGILFIKLDSSYGRSFLSQIFNVDFSKSISFNPWTKVTDDGQKKTRLYLGYEDKKSVDWKLPAGTPEVKFVDVKGKKIIDNISQIQHMDFLVEKLNDLIKSNGLQYVTEKVDLGESVDTGELSAEEQRELNKLKSQNTKKEANLPPITKDDLDFFSSL